MKTFDAYVTEVRDLHKQCLSMFKDIKENHLAHIEPAVETLKTDVSQIKTEVSFIKDNILSFESKLDQLIEKVNSK